MKLENLKCKILSYISNNSGTSFVEIENIFEENNYKYNGNVAFCNSKNTNIIFWTGWKQEAINIILELLNDKKIEMESCELLIYLVDGKRLKLPILNKPSDAKELCWLPVSFKIKEV
ncbi:pathogenicity island protein [Staphylococcus hominis]|uniref:pathogenicity island protein n=1 Tax=Staphylococcus hominis TaxID=1290 RepID=UPI0035E1869D